MTDHSYAKRQYHGGQRLAALLLMFAASSSLAAPAKSPPARPVRSAAPVVAPGAPPAPRVRPFVAEFVPVEVAPEYLHEETCAPPAWPKASLRNEETGTVTLYTVVASNGRTLQTGVQRSSGFRDLDRASLEAFKACKFKPGTIDGAPEQMTLHIQYVWTLK